MTPITIVDSLPFVSITVYANGNSIVLDNVLLDTASAACAFPTDALEDIGVRLEPGDTIQEMVGIGGSEYVVEKRITGITVGELVSGEINVQLGKLGYLSSVNGILGLDFLLQTGAVIDLKTLDIRKG